jgi:hypothetical protein
MPKFVNSLRDWNTDVFPRTLKHELEHLPAGMLPLDKGVAQGGMVDDNKITATVLSFNENTAAIQAKVGIFFTEIIINCGCGDDPMPTNAYCEIQILIDKQTAETDFSLLQDQAGSVTG